MSIISDMEDIHIWNWNVLKRCVTMTFWEEITRMHSVSHPIACRGVEQLVKVLTNTFKTVMLSNSWRRDLCTSLGNWTHHGWKSSMMLKERQILTVNCMHFSVISFRNKMSLHTCLYHCKHLHLLRHHRCVIYITVHLSLPTQTPRFHKCRKVCIFLPSLCVCISHEQRCLNKHTHKNIFKNFINECKVSF